jgi:hypothetical protein
MRAYAFAGAMLLCTTIACGEAPRSATPGLDPSERDGSTAEAPATPAAPGNSAPDPAPAPAEPPPPTAQPVEPPPVPLPPSPPPEVAETPAPVEGEAADDEGSASAAPSLTLDELERELRSTPALGFFSRLALKNDIDDLLDAVRDFHQNGDGRLDDLRERFDLLVLKVMSLLQDDDPGLARRIADAREALWALLEDPLEFAKLST